MKIQTKLFVLSILLTLMFSASASETVPYIEVVIDHEPEHYEGPPAKFKINIGSKALNQISGRYRGGKRIVSPDWESSEVVISTDHEWNYDWFLERDRVPFTVDIEKDPIYIIKFSNGHEILVPANILIEIKLKRDGTLKKVVAKNGKSNCGKSLKALFSGRPLAALRLISGTLQVYKANDERTILVTPHPFQY